MDSKSKFEYNDSFCGEFQKQVSKVLVRHRSILDIMTKLDEFNTRTNRAIAKSVTSCGCISINASKQDFGSESFQDMGSKSKTHVENHLCENCKDIIEEEIGAYLFYLAALSNTLDLSLSNIINREYDRLKTLGVYSLK